jgi:O-antigen ligase/tetratricopeptide (TPR) repeat protein
LARSTPTSKRRKKRAARAVKTTTAAQTSPASEAAEPNPGPPLLRRTLLLVVTALAVAWPFVPGEDPGQLHEGTGTAGMVLTLLWLVTGVGWAAWRLWSREGAWYAGLVDLGLFVTVAVVFVSAEAAARYKHPARLIAWEWVGLIAAFFLVRQLAVSPDERHGLCSALLATTVALSAYGVFQAAVELPSLSSQASEVAPQDPLPVPEELSSDSPVPVQDQHVSGTFRHPDTFAAYLALFLPGLVAAVVVCRLNALGRWQTVLAATCALLGAVALWMTHSRGAILATLAVGLTVAAVAWRGWLSKHRLAALGGAALVGAAVCSLFVSDVSRVVWGEDMRSWEVRLEPWRGTWEMIASRPWLGVGPGNFGRTYPRFMEATAAEKPGDPHDFALEMWATSGVFALLALAATLAVFFTRVLRWLGSAKPEVAEAASDPTTEPTTEPPPLRWEFYLGGMFGLLLGFILRVGDREPNAILTEGVLAGGRSLVWFACFALLEQLVWPERVRVTALAAGVAALLLSLTVSGGISFPSVAGPLWAAVALTLGGLPQAPLAWVARQRVLIPLPLPALTAAAMLYVLYVFYPVTAADNLNRKALAAGRFYLEDRKREPGERKIKAAYSTYLRDRVIGRLRESAGRDPDNARTLVYMANWHRELWDLTRPPDTTLRGQQPFLEALTLTGLAEARDPDGTAPLLARCELYRDLVSYSDGQAERARKKREKETDPKKQKELESQEKRLRTEVKRSGERAAETLRQLTELDPTEARLRYRLAEALFQAEKKEPAREQAREALRLDEAADPVRSLTNSQREQLQKWLEAAPAS